MQSLSDYEASEEERAFMRAVVAGLADLDVGRELSLEEAKVRLGLLPSENAFRKNQRSPG